MGRLDADHALAVKARRRVSKALKKVPPFPDTIAKLPDGTLRRCAEAAWREVHFLLNACNLWDEWEHAPFRFFYDLVSSERPHPVWQVTFAVADEIAKVGAVASQALYRLRVWSFELGQHPDYPLAGPNPEFPESPLVWAVPQHLDLDRESNILREVRSMKVISIRDAAVRFRELLARSPDAAFVKVAEPSRPEWDRNSGLLRYNGEVIRKFRQLKKSANVVAILDAFQEAGWPNRIDMPTQLRGGSAPDERLRDSVKSLNSSLTGIRFFSDGTGTGIEWRVESPAAHSPAHSPALP